MVKTEPCSGLSYGWNSSESWGTGMDNNLKLIGQRGIHPVVISRSLTSPPGSPALGDRYIVPSGATGAWVGRTNQVAVFLAGGWQFMTPAAGWVFFVSSESGTAYYNGASWSLPGISSASFTPTIYGSTTAGSPSYSVRTGFYTTNGPLLEVSVRVEISATGHGMAGDLRISGHPTVSSLGLGWSDPGVFSGMATSLDDTVFVVADPNSNFFYFETRTPGSTVITASDLTTGTAIFRFTIRTLRDF
jgi:hypothetical protein